MFHLADTETGMIFYHNSNKKLKFESQCKIIWQTSETMQRRSLRAIQVDGIPGLYIINLKKYGQFLNASSSVFSAETSTETLFLNHETK